MRGRQRTEEVRRGGGRDAPRPGGVVPAPARRLLALQASAGNAAVAQLLAAPPVVVARQPRKPPAPPPPPKARVSYVFLMGEMTDPYYAAARAYFSKAVKGATVVQDKRTLADVIGHVNGAGKPVDTLFIVSHAGDSGFLQFSLDAGDLKRDNKPNLTYDELEDANARGLLPKANTKLIDDQTKIQIKGCDIGRSERTLDELDKAFGGRSSVTAPTHAQEFNPGGPGAAPSEHLNRMFVEWPGDVKKKPAEVATAFRAKYPMVPAARWKSLLPLAVRDPKANELRFVHTQPRPIGEKDGKAALAYLDAANKWPRSQGWTVSYAGRRTADDDYVYEVRARKGDDKWRTEYFRIPVPPTDQALIDKEKARHGRPDGSLWRVKKSPPGGDLTLEVVAERTEWFITGTLEDAKGPIKPPPTDQDFYRTSTFAPAVPKP